MLNTQMWFCVKHSESLKAVSLQWSDHVLHNFSDNGIETFMRYNYTVDGVGELGNDY